MNNDNKMHSEILQELKEIKHELRSRKKIVIALGVILVLLAIIIFIVKPGHKHYQQIVSENEVEQLKAN